MAWRNTRRRDPSTGVKCPTPVKARHRSFADAKRALRVVLPTADQEMGELVAYQCSCGWWHLGNIPRKGASDE